MKPKAIELIPVYGMCKYYSRYFQAEKRNELEAVTASWMSLYYLTINALFVILIGWIALHI